MACCNPEGGELDPAVDDRRRCKNSSVLSCIDKAKKAINSSPPNGGAERSYTHGATLPFALEQF